MGDWDGTVHCTVTAFDPPQRLAYSWKGGSLSNPTYGSALDSVVELGFVAGVGWHACPNGAFRLRPAERNGL